MLGGTKATNSRSIRRETLRDAWSRSAQLLSYLLEQLRVKRCSSWFFQVLPTCLSQKLSGAVVTESVVVSILSSRIVNIFKRRNAAIWTYHDFFEHDTLFCILARSTRIYLRNTWFLFLSVLEAINVTFGGKPSRRNRTNIFQRTSTRQEERPKWSNSQRDQDLKHGNFPRRLANFRADEIVPMPISFPSPLLKQR